MPLKLLIIKHRHSDANKKYKGYIAAGAIIVREAGGIVGDIHGTDNFLKTGHIVCGNPRIFADMIRKIKPFVAEVDSLYSLEQ